jgi:hypothetical protein
METRIFSTLMRKVYLFGLISFALLVQRWRHCSHIRCNFMVSMFLFLQGRLNVVALEFAGTVAQAEDTKPVVVVLIFGGTTLRSEVILL